jgi:LEA14-like dessication related protein
MKIGNWLLLAAAIGYFAVMKGKDAYNKFDWSFKEIKLGQPTLQGIVYTLTFSAKNNNDFPISMESYDGKIFYGANAIGDISIPSLITIAAMSEGEFIFKGIFKYGNIFNELAEVIATKTWAKEFRTKGIFKVRLRDTTVSVPIDQRLNPL